MTLQTDPPAPSDPKETFITFNPKVITDPARYLVDPGDGRTNPGQMRHVRPHIVSGSKSFSWPVGIEGFRITGQAQLSIHHYLGDGFVDAKALHREESRIELTGTFPGLTAVANMIELRDTLKSTYPGKGMILYAQGIFGAEQFVVPESWEFTHEATDRTHSIGYSVTLVRVGTGKTIPDPSGIPPPENPGTKTTPVGDGTTFIVRSGARTFRQIAKIVYGTERKWIRLSELNGNLINMVPGYQVPMILWPLGTKVKY